MGPRPDFGGTEKRYPKVGRGRDGGGSLDPILCGLREKKKTVRLHHGKGASTNTVRFGPSQMLWNN